MILMVHWCGSSLLPLHLACLAFPCILLFRVRVLPFNLPLAVHICFYFCWLSHFISFESLIGHKFCATLLSTFTFFHLTHNSPVDSLPSIHNCHFMVYCMMHGFLLKNQDQDMGSPHSIFADLFWMFVVDSSEKYVKE